MKKNLIPIFAMLVFIFTGCKNNTKETETTNVSELKVKTPTTAKKHLVDIENSNITWTGSKPTGSHTGTVKLKNGELTLNNNGTVKSGTFTIDMNSIKDADNSERLEGHLKNSDFFDVANHPNATFNVTASKLLNEKTILSGDLTIKNITHNIEFPVILDSQNNIVTLTSDTFTIDRSKWEIRYGSKSFFNDLGDKFINDAIELKIVLKTMP